jgi:hypothetical protein
MESLENILFLKVQVMDPNGAADMHQKHFTLDGTGLCLPGSIFSDGIRPALANALEYGRAILAVLLHQLIDQ